jgi:hypothetical protein
VFDTSSNWLLWKTQVYGRLVDNFRASKLASDIQAFARSTHAYCCFWRKFWSVQFTTQVSWVTRVWITNNNPSVGDDIIVWNLVSSTILTYLKSPKLSRSFQKLLYHCPGKKLDVFIWEMQHKFKMSSNNNMVCYRHFSVEYWQSLSSYSIWKCISQHTVYKFSMIDIDRQI